MSATTVASALTGRHALVTGGSRGIGAAIAVALASHGARVTLLGRDQARLRATAQSIGPAAVWVLADVAERAEVDAAFATALERQGPIDILINNAGVAASAPFLKTSPALWAQMLAVNLNGTYHCIQAALPGMIERNYGRIVNVASTAGLVGYAYCTAYGAAKHAVVGLTRSLAIELAPRNITINAVCPGFTDTDIVRDAIANIREKTGRSDAQATAALVARNPQQRLVSPAEVAHAALWLCLPGAEAMTGQSIAVAGGEVT